jgi:hypothetical protein
MHQMRGELADAGQRDGARAGGFTGAGVQGMKKSISVKWESFTENGFRFVRETCGDYSEVLGPLHEYDSFTRFIERRRFMIAAAIWQDREARRKKGEQDERREAAFREHMDKERMRCQ